METDPLATALVGGIALAFAFAYLAARLRAPLIPAYIAAGALAGPYVLGWAEDPALIGELRDLGLILLLFGLGLRFPPPQRGPLRRTALPGPLVQVAASGALGYGAGLGLGLGSAETLVLAVSVPFASAFALLSAMDWRGGAASEPERSTAYWLGVQAALAMIALLAVTALARSPGAGAPLWNALGEKAALLGGFVVALVVLSRRVLPPVLVFAARAKSREAFSLAVLAAALGLAWAAYALLGAGFAPGAFLAGLALSQSDLSRRAGGDLIPFRDACAALFFVALGMSLDQGAITQQAGALAVVAGVMTAGNAAAAFLGAWAVRLPMAERLALAGSFAQAGEFAVMIAGAAFAFEMISPALFALIMAGTAVSICVNPLIRPLVRIAERRYA